MFAEFIASLTGKKSDSYLAKLESHFGAHFQHRWQSIEEMCEPGSIDAYASDRLSGNAPAVEAVVRGTRPTKGAPVTVHKELVTLRRFLKWAKKKEIITDLPDIEPVPQISDYAPPDYTAEDARSLLEALPSRKEHRSGHPVREFFTVQWAQATRPGEIESLRVCDVNLERREMTIRQSEDKARVGRVIGIAPMAYDVLKELLAGVPVSEMMIFGPRNYRASLEQAAKACGLPRPTRHNLRHFRLTELGHTPGMAPASLQFLAGHKHMNTTDRYVRSRTQATHDLFALADGFRPGGAKQGTPRREDLPDSAPAKTTSRRRKHEH